MGNIGAETVDELDRITVERKELQAYRDLFASLEKISINRCPKHIRVGFHGNKNQFIVSTMFKGGVLDFTGERLKDALEKCAECFFEPQQLKVIKQAANAAL